MKTLLSKLFNRKHKWQTRGTNMYGKTTYRFCTRCGSTEKWVSGINGHFVKCDNIPELDDQFDSDNKFIF